VTGLLILSLGFGALCYYEALHSPLQAYVFTRWAGDQVYSVAPGVSPTIALPEHGPFDRRLGYTRLEEFRRRLESRGFELRSQARMSLPMLSAIRLGISPPFAEKESAGLEILDCAGRDIFRRRYPERTYESFDEIPELLRESLVFIENRELLKPSSPTQNPAIEWRRLTAAIMEQLRALIDPEYDGFGASTLATQIEKYRHSPDGRTSSALEKALQMTSASLRIYQGGADTRTARQELVRAYLNTVPLAARVGHGEVHGIGDGLWVWYGRDFEDFNQVLRDPQLPLRERALVFKQALSLLVSERRPSLYLVEAPETLDELTNVYLERLALARVVPRDLLDAARALRVRPGATPISETALSETAVSESTLSESTVSEGAAEAQPFVAEKASTAARSALSRELGSVPLYALERMDIEATTSFDDRLQQQVTELLRELSSADGARRAGLNVPGLLGDAPASDLAYSFTLYERLGSENVVRVQTDNLNQPFDLNSGSKLDLGSTAKLRTFVTYLEIIAELHERMSPLATDQLSSLELAPDDALSGWARDFLLRAPSTRSDLRSMLEAALERRYSASPDEAFFTHGGILRFSNFDAGDDASFPSVREGLERSINLLFVRLMRDIVHYARSNAQGSSVRLLRDRDDPRRNEYLRRFADREGSEFVRRFYRKHAPRPAAARIEDLIRQARADARELAAIFVSVNEDVSLEAFRAFVERADLLRGTETATDSAALTRAFGALTARPLSLSDRGYIAGVHPLELWTVRFLAGSPRASLEDALRASEDERQAVYRWLFRTPNKRAQDERIETLLELEAFVDIHRRWVRLGYPFGSLVPSYATALGSSADRPSALAELMGILVNGGLRRPSNLFRSLTFARGTPYETHFAPAMPADSRVLPEAVAQVTLQALAGVVERGTARRLRGVFRSQDGSALPVGGKTGTGDHRFETFDASGRLLSSRVLSRSGTLVFYLGDRHFGVLTAYVEGKAAEAHRFTSALPTQILSLLAPSLAPVLSEAEASCSLDSPPAPREVNSLEVRALPRPNAAGSARTARALR